MQRTNRIKLMSVIGIAATGIFSLYAAVDVTKLPLGDGKISTTPQKGYVYACETPHGGGGAQADGSWIHGGTWNSTQKLASLGDVAWPLASFSVGTSSGDVRVIVGNGLPVQSHTGVFPISQTDPAYQIDRNPNTITGQHISYTLPKNPSVGEKASCVPMGAIGVALNGVAIFNALDGEGRDAVAHEVQDTCNGHPEREGEYHYHGPSSCMPHANENNALVGYALDGFGIYSGTDAQGNDIATSALDECHGTTSEIMWDGQSIQMYHYVLTKDYPYTVGCFKGAKVSESVSSSLPVQMSDDSQSRLLLPEGQQMDEGFQMATSGRPLLVGMKGKDIEELQKMLEQFGYLVMPKNVTKGIFGTKTKDAVKRFQKDNNVTQTGTFGPKSRKAARERKGAVSRSVQLETRTDTSAPSSRPMNMRVRTATTTSSFHPEDMRGGDSNQQGNDAPPMNVQMSHEMGRADAMPLPPQEAVTACDSLQENDVCGFSRPDNGEKISGTCREIHEDLACVPSRR